MKRQKHLLFSAYSFRKRQEFLLAFKVYILAVTYKQLMVRVSASGKFSSTHLFSLPAVCFLQTEMANLHKASPY